MNFSDFLGSFKSFMDECPVEPLVKGRRYVFLSDLHMGDGGSRDDLFANRHLIRAALSSWYLARGYTLILGGDIEELQKFKRSEVERAWASLYGIFDEFHAKGDLRKIIGNHDLALIREKTPRYPFVHGLRLGFGEKTLFCFHGHQASRIFVDYQYISDFVVRYLAKPLKVKNTSVSGDSRQRFKAERRIYRASKSLGIVSITGHTHRPLFESLSKYDSLRWSIEDLLREYPRAEPERRAKIEELVGIYQSECNRLGKKDMRWELSKGLYEEKALLIPCLYNSGCATGRHGITALEIEDAKIGLVHWSREGDARPYISREALRVDTIPGAAASRYLLREVGLEEVFARIELLGGSSQNRE